MSDKVQLIKEEIERRISQFEAKYPKDLGGYWNDEESAAFDCAEEYKRFLQFIDSLPEEHNEDLEEEIKNYIQKEYSDGIGFPNVPKIARHFAEWQKQKDLEDLFKSDMTMPNKFYEKGKADAMKEMKETLQTEYEKGRFDMREEMMKDAVGGQVVYQIGSAEISPIDIRYKVMSDRVYIPNVKLGDKVKIIVIKTE